MFLSCHVRVFRVNPHFIVAWLSRNSLLEAGSKSEGEVTATGLEPKASLAKWLSVRLRTKWFWVRVQLQSLNLILLIKPFCYMTIKSRQKLKYLENKKSFLVEIKSIFHHFFSSQKLSQTWEFAFKVFYRCLTVNLNLNWYFLRDIINWKKYFAVFGEI